MRKVTWLDRLRYAFDNTLARGPAALIAWLALASAALIVAISLAVRLAGLAPERSLPELLWMSLMRTLDPGTMGGDEGSWPFLLAMLAVTFGGIFVISTLIGVITSGIEARLEELRKGRARVVERDHSIVLGWTDSTFTVVSELVQANANRRRACLVVLAEHDKVEMEDALREKVGPTGGTRLVCRTGSPLDMDDLEIAGLHESRSVIVLSPGGDDPDAEVIKTLLAIRNHPRRRPEPYHVVAEIREPRNLDAARLAGGEETELVLAGDLIARIVAQTCRQSGLSAVYTELLDFAGDEVYFQEEPALVGRTFGEALLAYEDSAVLGVCPRGGAPRLNPPMDTTLAAGDRLIALSEDDDTVRLAQGPPAPIDEAAIVRATPAAPQPVRTLVLGWNWRGPAIVRELDHYVAPGSSIEVVADCPGCEESIPRQVAGLRNQALRLRPGDTTDRHTLDSLGVEGFDHVIVLSYAGFLTARQADARTLVTLLHLRRILDRSARRASIVSEMLDVRTRALAEVARADDYIVSDQLISLALAQISENKALNAVLQDLFDPAGSEVYLKPAGDYVRPGAPVSFYTVVEAARRRGEVAFGYRRQDAGAAADGVVLNPAKSVALVFQPDDRIVVLAES